MNLLLSALLCFLLCSMLPVDSMMIHPKSTLGQPVPLNMAEDAVDDMYDGCTDAMAETVKNKYFEEENTGIFGRVWENAAECAEENLQQRDSEDQDLTRDHMQAICVYTAEYEHFYEKFNDHVRNNRSIYTSHFPFHSLHFWLTSAVQTLNQNNKCHTTYRRTDLQFSGRINQRIRFGYFASSSYKTTLKNFGQKTCFQIRTCSGGFMKHYSAFWDTEQEVLIPPYEVFNITDRKSGSAAPGLTDCEVVYVLESAGVQSHLNCGAIDGRPSAGAVLVACLCAILFLFAVAGVAMFFLRSREQEQPCL
ncbi:ecto-ADP-ribosyltransferase 5-like [Anabas testudineus]|uniref:ecto-ADP-ribosyltransferase 5-like n=1 Tax=Anabas testudineus TaxID=64144 RepID=UPI000E46236E|nr:ecto-ADP-ribosyltransferase 5-like [Anabas testudineus]